MQWDKVETVGLMPPCASLSHHSASVVGDRIFCFGGQAAGVISAKTEGFYCLDVSCRPYRWSRPSYDDPFFPPLRNFHSASVVGSDIYIFGGKLGNTIFNDIHVFHTLTGKWEKIKPTSDQGSLPQSRYSHAAAVVGTNIFIFGGYNGSKDLNDVFMFDTEERSWIKIVPKGSPPSTRSKHSASVIGKNIFFVGGFDGGMVTSGGVDGSSVRDVHVLDTEYLQWLSFYRADDSPIIPPPARNAHSSIVLNKKLLVFGGCASWNSKDSYYDFYILDPSSSKIFSKPKVTGTHPTGRYGHTASLVGGSMILIGGDRQAKKEEECYVTVLEVGELYDDAFIQIEESTRSHFMGFVNNDQFHDITVLTADQVEIPAPRILLYCGCPALRSRLNAPVIEFPDIKSSVMFSLLQFIYSGSIKTWKMKTIVELYLKAKQLELDDLAELCKYHVQHLVTTKNYHKLLANALRHGCDEMEQFANHFINNHHSEIKESFQSIENITVLRSMLYNLNPQTIVENPFQAAFPLCTRHFSLERLETVELYTDVVLLLHESEPIRCHAVILSRNDYFRSALMDNLYSEGASREIDFSSNPLFKEAKALEAFLDFMYGPEVAAKMPDKCNLLYGASYFADLTLVEYVRKRLALNDATFWETLRIAIEVHEEGLKQRCLNYLWENSDLVHLPELEHIRDPTVLVEIIRMLSQKRGMNPREYYITPGSPPLKTGESSFLSIHRSSSLNAPPV